MLLVIDKKKDIALVYATIGLIKMIKASEKPPTSLTQASNVPLLLSCKYFEFVSLNENFICDPDCIGETAAKIDSMVKKFMTFFPKSPNRSFQ